MPIVIPQSLSIYYRDRSDKICLNVKYQDDQ